ncbi:MAG TPA: response regulator transcription factor [Chloroflexota bacterium]
MATATEVVKVMVADDHSLFRAGLRELLEEEDQAKVVGEASTGKEAVEQALRTHPDVVVMDVKMPEMDGIEASRQIKQRLPRTEIVMVTGLDDEDQLFRAIDAGARSYVSKDDDPQTIIQAVHSAHEGSAYLPPRAVQQLMERISAGRPGPSREAAEASPRLTPREKEVLRMLATGRRNQEIANAMGLSVRSVGNHLAKIYNKLHIHGRSEAVVYAVRTGIAQVQ